MKKKFMPAIQRPCGQDWNTMQGDGKRRFCEHCQLHVHNLGAMTPAEQRTLFTADKGRKCVTYKNEEGTLMVRSGLWLFLQRWKPAAAALAAIIPLVFSGCASSREVTGAIPPAKPACHSTTVPDDKEVKDGKDQLPMTGEVAAPPLWRRILWFLP